ncbi:uncharacterized protein [Pseudorasbora parva]|uniref:uncharacterized protein n=1 Tax=Pseudorasbora parva TaxID=51549 RepID=UPI00351E7CC8
MAESKVYHHDNDSDCSDDIIGHLPAVMNRVRIQPDKRAHHDATLLNPGPPALYRLNTGLNNIDGDDRKIKRWTYGRKDKNKQNKVVILAGETGAGKTALINTIINHLLGVKFEDQEFYQITEEEQHEDQSQSQTSEVTVYEVFVEENPTSLTIIDTPGYYAHSNRFKTERKTSEDLSSLFSAKEGIHSIDAVCFVMKASQKLLSGKERYIFHSFLSRFGRDIENNIVFLFTHSDGSPPTEALNAIKTAEIPYRRDENNEPVHFLFNNRQKEKRDKRYDHVYRSSWEMGEKSVKEFLTLLKEENRKSVPIKLDVLKEPTRLEACLFNQMDHITEKELKMKELNQIQEALRQKRDKIERGENFTFTVNRVFKEKVAIENAALRNLNATCCSVCEENCHEFGCWWVPPCELYKCDIMKDEHCTVCPGRCHYSKHIKENKKYVTRTKPVIMTFDKLKQEYGRTGEKPETSFHENKYEDTGKEESENKTEIQNLKSELEKIKTQKSILLHEAYKTIMSLSKFEIDVDSAFTDEHLKFFIEKLEEEKKEDDERIIHLVNRRKEMMQEQNKLILFRVMENVCSLEGLPRHHLYF